jgi:hypothetical protein
LEEPKEGRCIAVGTARLPKTVAGDQGLPLMIELSLDRDGQRIVDIATSVTLPGYVALLRSFLVGVPLDEVMASAARNLTSRLRGPLLKPTLAALANAVGSGPHPAAVS